LNPPNYQLVRVANGAWSVHSTAEDETFHPVVGPVAEAEALYLRQLDLRSRISRSATEFVIWDVGLGAGGNVLTILNATQDIPTNIRILSFDRTIEPLRFALQHREALGYVGGYAAAIEELANNNSARVIEPRRQIHWQLHVGDFPQALACAAETRAWLAPDAILFDAFSPATNPEMWTAPVFANLFRALDPLKPCSMATYSRSTLLRVTLLLAGFYVGVGHATGEKEETTIAANRLDMLEQPLPETWLGRARNSKSAEPLWTPQYRQARISPETLQKLVQHPQFNQPKTPASV
jgi:tRNA U34 5-methylaminomethyl-2-thiouridine-forming methyltransferase MnmC